MARGKIVTFYSYKGGTGRTMALANVACLLARRKDVTKGVLAIDWDLDAPGLHCFFRTSGSLEAPEGLKIDARMGLLDMFEHLRSEIERGRIDELGEDSTEKIVRQVPLKEYTVSSAAPRVDVMVAGRLDTEYGERVTRFDWRDLFKRAPSLIRILAEYLAEQYDYVLVDARTGINDISSICTSLLPDKLVIVFTPNRQSLIGGIDASKRALRYRIESDDLRPLIVFPLPSRIDVSEPELLEKWRFGDSTGLEDSKGYQERFEQFFKADYGLTSCNLKNYFDEIQIQHVPRYSYGEEIAALRERGTRLSISRSYAAFVDILVREDLPCGAPPSTQAGAELLAVAAPTLVKLEATKEYLSEERFKLKLHDLIVRETRGVVAKISQVGLQDPTTAVSFGDRLKAYEAITNDLFLIEALLAQWGSAEHASLLQFGPRRLCDQVTPQNGFSIWLAARWYPALLLLYAGGIAAVAAQRYDNLLALMIGPVAQPVDRPKIEPTVLHVVADGILELEQLNAFKSLPGLERHYTPRSDYLHAFFGPILDELLFLGTDYETSFDRFEAFYATQYAHLYSNDSGFPYWGPVGRFAWKRGPYGGLLEQLIREAESEGPAWLPTRAGLFGGSVERFREVATGFLELVQRSRWF